MNVYELRYIIPDDIETCKKVFVDDGSIEYKEFMKQIELYLKDPIMATNSHSYKVLKDGIKTFMKLLK